jgi:hypothetical protein
MAESVLSVRLGSVDTNLKHFPDRYWPERVARACHLPVQRSGNIPLALSRVLGSLVDPALPEAHAA